MFDVSMLLSVGCFYGRPCCNFYGLPSLMHLWSSLMVASMVLLVGCFYGPGLLYASMVLLLWMLLWSSLWDTSMVLLVGCFYGHPLAASMVQSERLP